MMSTDEQAQPVVPVEREAGDLAGVSTEKRLKGLANLRPSWKPGQSGNPSGRPKGIFGKAALKQLRKRAESGETNLDAVVGAQVGKAIAKADTHAAEFLRDVVDGKPESSQASAGAAIQVNISYGPPGSCPELDKALQAVADEQGKPR
jgi:hypothetical protein